jgi:hypothetical protein
MAAMEAPTISVETAIPVEPTIAVELMAVAKSMFPVKPAIATELTPAPAVMIPVSAESTSTPIITIPAAMPASAVPARMAPIRVIPRPYANKYAVHKPLRPIEAVRRAGVGVVIIIAIGANRRWADISWAVIAWAHSNAYNHSLRARKRSAKEANP